MVSLIDILDDGLSSVYTFFDPDVAQSSFGTYNVLWQIELCRNWSCNIFTWATGSRKAERWLTKPIFVRCMGWWRANGNRFKEK